MVHRASDRREDGATRREFLGRIGQTALLGGLPAGLGPAQTTLAANPPAAGRVGQRILGKTGLQASEIGFGGHRWNFARVPDGKGGLRRTTA